MKSNPIRRSRAIRIAFGISVLLMAAGGPASAEATGEEPRQGSAQTVPDQEVNANQAPSIGIEGAGLSTIPTFGEQYYRALAPIAAADKGSTYTDMGLALPSVDPTSLERAKLDLARAAVEAARAAGTLYLTTPADAHHDPSVEGARAKLDLLATTPPAQLPPDPAAAVGPTPPPVQLVGPPQLTPAEIQKLEEHKDTGGSR